MRDLLPPAPTRTRRALIAGTGCCVPEAVRDNASVAGCVDTSDQWIVERTGIHERRVAPPEVRTSDLAIGAARAALEAAGLTAADLDLILVATVTPDRLLPAVGPLVQHALGARCPAYDLAAACAGFVYGLESARAHIESGLSRHVLLIGVDLLTRWVDWTDRDTCVLFGDGAGAVVLSAVDAAEGRGLHRTLLGADGSEAELLRIEAGGTSLPASSETLADRAHFIRMEGRALFRQAVTHLVEVIGQVLAASEWAPADLDLVVPHQANQRILDAVAERVGVSRERIFANLHAYGNTSAASIPIALDEAVKAGRLRPGDKVLFAAFGAGLVWGAATHVW